MHRVNEMNICGQRKKEYECQRKKKEMIEPEELMMGKEVVVHEHVSLLCSTQVGSPSVCLWYVL